MNDIIIVSIMLLGLAFLSAITYVLCRKWEHRQRYMEEKIEDKLNEIAETLNDDDATVVRDASEFIHRLRELKARDKGEILRWEVELDGGYLYCPICKMESPHREITKYCAYCGARLEFGHND